MYINNIFTHRLKKPQSAQMINTLFLQNYTPNKPLLKKTSFSNRQFSLASDTVTFNKQSIQTTPKPLLSFTGLTQALSAKLFKTNNDIKQLIEKEEHKNSPFRGIVGNLPDNWMARLSKDNKESDIKQIYTAFADAANLINTKFKEVESLGFKNEDLPKLEPQLTEARNIITKSLKDHGLIKDKAELGFEHVGQGRYGITFKFNIEDQLFIYKVFFINAKQTSSELSHGILKEVNRAAFIKKHVGPCQYPELFFADMKSGYMITRLINNDSKAPLFIKEGSYGARNGDVNEDGPNKGKYVDQNVINGYVVDYGGISIENSLLATNKTVRWVYNQFRDLPELEQKLEKWDELYKTVINNNIPNCHDIMLGLIDYICVLPAENQKEIVNKLLADDKLPEKYLLEMKPRIIDRNSGLRYRFSEMERSDYYLKIFDRLSKPAKNDLLKEITKHSGFYITEIFKSISSQLDEPTKKMLAESVRYQYRYEAQWKEAVNALYP